MEQLRKFIKKVLLKELYEELVGNPEMEIGYATRAERGLSTKDMIDAENMARSINEKGKDIRTVFFSKSINSSYLKKSSYMLQSLINAIANQKDKMFTFPTTNITIEVDEDKIAEGIGVFFTPMDYRSLAFFLSGHGNFHTTENELESLDLIKLPNWEEKHRGVLGQITKVLEFDNIKKLIRDYISQNPSADFLVWMRTQFVWKIEDLRKIKRGEEISIDEPFGSGEKTKGEKILPSTNITDKESIEAAEKEAIRNKDIYAAILNINYSIYEILLNETREGSYNAPLWYYSVIGVGGSNKKRGNTLTNAEILQKYYEGDIDPRIKNTFNEKLKKTAPKLFGSLPDEYLQNFKQENPNSFDENGNIIVTNELVKFIRKYGQETMCHGCDKYSPLQILKWMQKNLIDFFADNPKRRQRLDILIKESGIISFDNGIKYLQSQLGLKSKKAKGEEDETLEPNNLSEEIYYEEFENEENMTFDEIYNLARRKRIERESSHLQEVRKKIKAILLKNSVK